MPKRIMRGFRIDELSGCDYPAQEGATVAIMKRGKPDDPNNLIARIEALEKNGGSEMTTEEITTTEEPTGKPQPRRDRG